MNTTTRVEQHDAWIRTVHDVAKYRSEGPRRIVAGGNNGCILEYEVAPLDQGYALKYGLEFPGYAGTYIGWTLYPTREAAIDELIAACSSRCRSELSPLPSACSGHHKAAAAAMLELLQPQSLFSFQEPEPAPRDEWLGDVIAWELHMMTLRQNWKLIDVVRGGDFRPMSKCGSFFEIPVPSRS